ncbi:xanthine dehydrogenase family protein molybdopterin-binding subunit [Kyrpidia tusciae]|uniref:Aldehyde oxidase and xanthine dehydrogenase molybdopterin binding protein n=1 Tax=Kyrpidia tusciae (strain DSM 2912 / NBRC 15312 / T2) TaxID=562970 RepID=D5WS48_KYRT2|nr:xanthine dehydrogenase family protein molybdopterin-binding subunit [Kyrpidia tusciae]ADG07000.1 aldehyde oxidase and xanthine dehydrogenase molybdopterin binding protein [Kyrpidia tusciae DSM 2912]
MSEVLKPQFTGARVTRLEDPRLLRGQGSYLDDLDVPGMLEIAFVRSTQAAARILSVDASEARRVPGVKAVFTAEDLPLALKFNPYDVIQPVLAKEEVRFVGEPIVAVVADNRYIAEDAAELVKVEYEAMEPVLDMRRAAADGPRRVHGHRPNLFHHREIISDGFSEAFSSAPRRMQLTFQVHRQTGVTLETRGCAATVDPVGGRLTVYVSHQSPHGVRSLLARALNMPDNRIRVVVPEVGGGFGIKAMFYPEYVAVAQIARLLGKPVKWVSDRTESLFTDAHARDSIHEVDVAFEEDGRIVAIQDHVIGDTGAYPFPGFPGAVGESNWATEMITGPYKIPHVSITIDAVFSNKAPLGPYRGVGGPIGAQVQEGIVEAVARALGKDSVEVRRVNMIGPEDFPYHTPTGKVYDPGSYRESLERAVQMLDYEAFRRKQEELRKQGRYLGVGFCAFVEPSAMAESEAGSTPYEAASIRIEPSGTVTAAFGLGPTGQGHETTMAQLIADRLGVDVGDVVVLHGDTDSAPFGGGTGGSRSGTIGGGAALRAGEEMRKKIIKLAAHLLEAAEEDIELAGGQAHVAGVPSRGISIREIARTAYADVSRLPEDMQPGLEVVVRYRPPLPATFSNGTHAAVVEVDIRTGFVKVLDYVVVNDCGRLINPMIVEGQIHGGVAQGIGSAFLEELRYDEDGQLVTGSLMDYLLPESVDVPRMRVQHLETPSSSEGGFKGMGEGSLIAAPAALANAVSDALAPFGVLVTELPIRPEQIVSWVEAARSKAANEA